MFENIAVRRLLLFGPPLVLAGLMLFHPSPYRDIAGELVPIAGFWISLHTIQFVLFAFMGVAIWALMDGLRGIDALISRMSAVVFVVFYNLGDVIAGVTTGILAQSAGSGALDLPAAVQAIEALFAHPLKNVFFEVGIYAWMVALATAAVALFRSGAPRIPLLLLAPAAYLLNLDHAFPFGSLTFAAFFLAVVWLEYGRKPSESSEREVRRVL